MISTLPWPEGRIGKAGTLKVWKDVTVAGRMHGRMGRLDLSPDGYEKQR